MAVWNGRNAITLERASRERWRNGPGSARAALSVCTKCSMVVGAKGPAGRPSAWRLRRQQFVRPNQDDRLHVIVTAGGWGRGTAP